MTKHTFHFTNTGAIRYGRNRAISLQPLREYGHAKIADSVTGAVALFLDGLHAQAVETMQCAVAAAAIVARGYYGPVGRALAAVVKDLRVIEGAMRGAGWRDWVPAESEVLA